MAAFSPPQHAEGTKFACQARFVGRKIVQGPLNDIGLSLVVTDLQTESRKAGSTVEDFRCNLEFGEKNLQVTYIKKDEGFESDGESTKSCSTEEVNRVLCSDVEEKIIKDHVFKITGNGSGDDTSSANSSGGSDDEAASSRGNNSNNHRLSSSTNSNAVASSNTSSKSTSPTSDIQKFKFDHRDAYPIGDVLICHTDLEFRNCVVWVIRTKNGALEALVFECANEEEVKELYRKFLEVSKRSKLEKHRRRKSDGGSVVSKSVEALFSRARKSGDKTKSVLLAGSETTAVFDIKHQNSQNKPLEGRRSWNLVQHTDKNGVTHIEVESSSALQLKQQRANFHSLTASNVDSDSNVIVHQAEINAVAPSSVGGIKPRGPGSAKSEKSKFAKELESILSKELETRRERESIIPAPLTSLTPVTTSVQTESKSNGAIPRVYRPTGESLSLRQRAPALLLKKLDEFEEKAQRVWAKAEADEENRKIWSKPTVVVSNGGSNINPSKGASRTPPPPSKRHHESLWKQQFVSQNQITSADNSPKLVSNHKSIISVRSPSPPPPNSIGMIATSASPIVVPKRQQENTSAGDKQILVPTKTGKEPVKKLYPKEATPDLMRGGRFVHVAALPHQGGLPHQPMQFAAQQFSAHQPHSLPIFPYN